MDDRTLLATFVRSRDDAAFAAIVARHGSMVLATARRQTRDAHRADDVAQAVFLILARRAASVDGSLGAWLHRTTILASRNANRVDARRRRHEREASVDRSRRTTFRVDDDDDARLVELDAALDRLGRADREVIALRFFEALDVAEIAGRLGVNVEAAKKRLSRAIDRLRRQCRGDIAVALGAIGECADDRAGGAAGLANRRRVERPRRAGAEGVDRLARTRVRPGRVRRVREGEARAIGPDATGPRDAARRARHSG